MGIAKAIARVRSGAKSAGLEGALASLGAGLRSDVIPERLRDAAARLATLLGGTAELRAQRADESQVVALEHALAAKTIEAQQAVLPGEHAPPAHAAEGVCPFTGLRADGTLAVPADEGGSTPAADPGEAPAASHLPAQEAPREPSSAAAPPGPTDEKPRARRVEARNSAREPGSAAARPASKRVEARSSVRERELKAHGPISEPAVRVHEKDKEGLAAERPVEKTSARSATRPARKQPRSKAQTSRKKA